MQNKLTAIDASLKRRSSFNPSLTVKHVGILDDKAVAAGRQSSCAVAKVIYPAGNRNDEVLSLTANIRAHNEKVLFVWLVSRT
jgi:hypothetical protein